MKKGTAISLDQLKGTPAARLNPHLFAPAEKKPKRSKYGNKKVNVDGKPFDSVREAKRYKELRILLKAGEISFLARQVEFELNSTGSHSVIYIADFTYTTKTGERIVEDVKGVRTKEFIKKRRLMKKVHGIIIKEI